MSNQKGKGADKASWDDFIKSLSEEQSAKPKRQTSTTKDKESLQNGGGSNA